MHACNCVGHAGAQILSLDVHKDGTRFVTSASDNKTRVWNLLVALDPTQEEDKVKPRLLATLTDHFEGVNAARFSRCVTSCSQVLCPVHACVAWDTAECTVSNSNMRLCAAGRPQTRAQLCRHYILKQALQTALACVP